MMVMEVAAVKSVVAATKGGSQNYDETAAAFLLKQKIFIFVKRYRFQQKYLSKQQKNPENV